MVNSVYNLSRRVWRLRNFVLIALACCVPACGAAAAKKAYDSISQEQGEELRDTCVADSLALVQALGDRIAPLARAATTEDLEATAIALGCTFETTSDGYRLTCADMNLRGSPLAVEFYLRFMADEVILQVVGSDATRTVDGMLTLRDEPERGLVLQGALEAINEAGCRAVAEFDEIIGLEAFDLPGDRSTLHFRAGAIDLTVFRDNALELARGTAALTGRNAFVVLNFDGFSLLSELILQ